MLLLQRRVGESIYIGDDIKLTVLDASHRQVRLGIQAPRNVAVHREEIYQRIQKEQSGQSANDRVVDSATSEERKDSVRRDVTLDTEQPQTRPYKREGLSARLSGKKESYRSRASHPFRRGLQHSRDDTQREK